MEGIVTERAGQKITVLTLENRKEYRGIPLGKVRKKEKIFAGDLVEGKVVDDQTFAIGKVKERKNLLVRPPIANVDKAVIVMTLKNPPLSTYLLDNLLVVYHYLNLETVIVFNKIDLLDEKETKELKKWIKIYQDAGYETVKLSTKTEEGLDQLEKILSKGITIFAGPSGVGKSSIISKLTGVKLKIGEVSRKTERGKHTTREVKLIPFKNGFIGDAPGFSRVEALNFMEKEEVKNHFPEFLKYTCKFSNCMHLNEEGCKVKEALKKGEISCERYKNYLRMIEQYTEWPREICG